MLREREDRLRLRLLLGALSFRHQTLAAAKERHTDDGGDGRDWHEERPTDVAVRKNPLEEREQDERQRESAREHEPSEDARDRARDLRRATREVHRRCG